jgi:hypothetical protein
MSNGLSAETNARKELYVPMDYSTCGYHASEQALPDVAEAVRVTWHEGDCSATIQQAIDRVSQLKPNRQGHRGAVVMGEGVFRLDRPLRIGASGVVLRGMGSGKTVLVKHGVARGALVYVEGSGIDATGSATTDTLYVDADKVMAGSTALPVHHRSGGEPLKAGDRIDIVRPCTKEWILSLAMNDFGGGLDYTGWKPTDIDISWDRTITAIHGDTIVVDAPVTTTISRAFGGAYIVRHRRGGELTECGVEHITLASAVNDWNAKDEDHCWDGIFMEHVRDCWVRHVDFRHFAGSAVSLQKETSRITVEDCISSEPVSEIGGWRRQTFLTRGQQTLFQRCISRHGIHDFAAGFCAAGPNAFVQCEGEESLGFSGSIGSWAAGLLFDIVNIDGNDIRFANLEQFQFGTGWNTANSMLWQCTASTIECYSPDPDNRSSAHGCWGTLTGNGEWTSSNDHVSPRSLFYDQLERRLAGRPELGANAVDPRILPRSTNATSSPTVEQAMALAQESLNEPRLTMEMWINEEAGPQEPIPVGKGTNTLTADHRDASYSTQGGTGGASACLSVGNQYNIPWWSGRVKDNFVKKEGRPAITRFVPGREGTGWTDLIDSVVAYLSASHYSSLSHHYGLWYDLRRTDHERVRRADGDVWAPFYEQPFARSGQGTAWDGLSRYDLTRPNQWYWSRLREFADKAAPHGITLFHHHYFQHNILEAGAHWVDCPWRPVNNVNMTGGNAPFPEPVPFAGDKRIFMAEQFYDETNATLRPLHRQYIRMCLDELKDQPNVVHLISAEYTGPLHFTRFWLQTIAEWEAETGRHATVALSCTKDAQDSVLADPVLSKVVDIIDIRYWHYNTKGLWAPEAGRNMAPRQWMRKMQVGKTGFDEAYRAVREYRERYPDKAVTFFAQQYPDYGWAVFMAGGSLANVPIDNSGLGARLLAHAVRMHPADGDNCLTLGAADVGYVVYCRGDNACAAVSAGRYDVYAIDEKTGAIRLVQKNARLDSDFKPAHGADAHVYWLDRK